MSKRFGGGDVQQCRTTPVVRIDRGDPDTPLSGLELSRVAGRPARRDHIESARTEHRVFAALVFALLQSAGPVQPLIVEAPDTPVRLGSVRILNLTEKPLVMLYEARNQTAETAEQFMVTVYIFDATGIRKGSQTAPGRRTLEPNASKYSAMVLDGFEIGPTDRLVVGVQQVQWAASGDWWRAPLQTLAEAKVKETAPR
jgi:hypothetical protein